MKYLNPTTTELFGMFVDRTAGESTIHNRLSTESGDAGNVILVGYGWLKLAEYNESRGVVTVFTGHQSIESKTVSKWLNQVAEVAEERGRDVVLSGQSPTVGTPNDGTKYIGNYIGDVNGDKSPVERDAMDEVIDSLSHVA